MCTGELRAGHLSAQCLELPVRLYMQECTHLKLPLQLHADLCVLLLPCGCQLPRLFEMSTDTTATLCNCLVRMQLGRARTRGHRWRLPAGTAVRHVGG